MQSVIFIYCVDAFLDGKSTCMTLGSRHKIQKAGKLNITIGDTPINSVISQKLLGLYIDETLSWNPHIDYLCSE